MDTPDYTLPLISSLLTAVIAAVVMARLVKNQRRKADDVFAILAARGPMTLDELAAATRTNFVMKGYFLQALDALAAEGKLEKTRPPKGHPRLRVLRDTKYGLPAASGAPS